MKRDNWEGGHRVPMIARWPGIIKAGTIADQTVCLTDLMATCAAIIGTDLPSDAAEDSVNLLPVLMDETHEQARLHVAPNDQPCACHSQRRVEIS